MQGQNMMKGADEPIANIMTDMEGWRDNQSTNNFYQQMVEQKTEPAPSFCASCHERIARGTLK